MPTLVGNELVYVLPIAANGYTAAILEQCTTQDIANLASASNSGFAVLSQSAIPSSHTSDTVETALATITVPANTMGANGTLRIITAWSYTNSANSKTLRIRFGGISGTAFLNVTTTSTVSLRDFRTISNRNAKNSQVGTSAAINPFVTQSTSPVTSAVDTTASTTLIISGQLASASDTVTLEQYTVELAYGA